MLHKIYGPEEERDRLLAPASIKPTLKVKRLDFRPIKERESRKSVKIELRLELVNYRSYKTIL
jgi:hypothetical protein